MDIRILLNLVFLMLHVSCSKKSSPNIVFILNDDQDWVLGGLEPMKFTRKLIAEQGATFTNAFVSTPVCCPSRSSILTGKYIHNHHVINNTVTGNCSGPLWRSGPEKKTIATYLQSSGYKTFYGGKYLNQYGKRENGGVEYVPPGYDRWIGLVGNSRYYNYTLSVDGREENHGEDYKQDYLTDLLTREVLQFIQDVASNATVNGNQPFFAMIAPPACHAPFTSAPQFLNKFLNKKAPRLPNFNIHPGHDKHWLLRQLPNGPLPDDIISQVDDIFRNRWRTLLSVDDMVRQIIWMLESYQILDNTYLIFTSDHGYHMGQFALPVDKRLPYETDIRVPLLIKGPNVRVNVKIKSPTVSVDLAPTVLDIAGIAIPPDMDGVSLLPLLGKKVKQKAGDVQQFTDNSMPLKYVKPKMELAWRTSLLIEFFGEADLEDVDPQCQQDAETTLCMERFACKCQDARNNTYACARILSSVENSLFCHFNDKDNFIEYYDLEEDPFQLTNKAFQDPVLFRSHRHHQLLKQHLTCEGNKQCFL